MTELLADTRHTAPDHAVDLLTRFQQAVAATPDRIAVSHHGALTFAELDRYTARLAGVLVATAPRPADGSGSACPGAPTSSSRCSPSGGPAPPTYRSTPPIRRNACTRWCVTRASTWC